MGAGKSEIYKAGHRLETQGRVHVASQVQRQSTGRILSSLGNFSLSLLRSSTDWMRPTHIREANLLYSKSTDLNVNHIFKIYLHRNKYLDWCLTRQLGTIT